MKDFLVKWVYFETIPGGETIPFEAFSKLHSPLSKSDSVWTCEFIDSYMTEVDAIMFGYLLNKGCELAIQCYQEPQPSEENYDLFSQACFLCIKCPTHCSFNDIILKMTNFNYQHKVFNVFPWPDSGLDM